MNNCGPSGHFEKLAPSREVQFYEQVLKLARLDFAQLVVESTDFIQALSFAVQGAAIADMHRDNTECESIAKASGLTALRACDRSQTPPEQSRPRHF